MTREEFMDSWGHVELAPETYEMLLEVGATPADFDKADQLLERRTRVGTEWGYFRATVWNLVAYRRSIIRDIQP